MLSGTCTGVSGHNSGRAWDWSIRADIPADAARVQALLSWLLADGAEMFRRAGLSYVIWDKKIFSAKHPEWRPYDGYDEDGSCARASCRDPHTSHVHFSFNEAGADGLTSFYDWLGSTTGTPAPLPLPSAPEPSFVPALAAFAVGMSGVLLVRRSRWWRKLAS